MSFLFWALKAKDAVETAIFWKRFKAWQAERDARLAAEKASKPPSVPLVMIAIVAAVMSTAATCGKQIVKDAGDLQIYCCVEHPEECRNLPITIPCPATPRPTVTSTGAPTPSSTPTTTPGPTSTPAPTATPTPGATAAPTETPTATPTPQPTRPHFEGFCQLPAPPWLRPNPPAVAVRVEQTGTDCPRGFTRVRQPDGRSGCVIDWECVPGPNDRSPATGAQLSLNFNHVRLDSGGMIRDIDNGARCGEDAWARRVCDGQIEPVWLYVQGENGPERGPEERPWASMGACEPRACAEATPTPAPTRPPSGPTPVPGAFPPQPEDFRINFVNTCGTLRYTKHLDNGQCRGKCDGTYRFIGTLRSTGERYGNTSDRDHWICAADPRLWDEQTREGCLAATPDELEQHRKTCELVGCREWFSPAGVELHVEGPATVEPDPENSYQSYITADCDVTLQIYGCVPDGARTDDGLPIPGGKGCGGPKSVRFQ